MNMIGNPQMAYPTVHVGGTSGKGSTATILQSILATKYCVGLNTSPHLVKINERIKINHDDITDQDFIEILNSLVPVITMMEKSRFGKPSHFEITTAIAFLYFYRRRVDIAVIEVGMGGKWDGTNVIDPLVAILTNVGLDHTQVLGKTVEKIAKDKVGIIKKNISVVSAVKKKSVVKIVQAKVKEQDGHLFLLQHDFSYTVKAISVKGSTFDYFGRDIYRKVTIPLIGAFQIENAVLAMKAIECLHARYPVSTRNIRDGLKSVTIAGRMEIVQKDPTILFDGAHNPDKVTALVDTMIHLFPTKKITCLIAIKSDKDAKSIIKILLPITTRLIITQYKIFTDIGDIASYTVHELNKIKNQYDKTVLTQLIPTPNNAYLQAIQQLGKKDVLLITGSLYLIGEIKKYREAV